MAAYVGDNLCSRPCLHLYKLTNVRRLAGHRSRVRSCLMSIQDYASRGNGPSRYPQCKISVFTENPESTMGGIPITQGARVIKYPDMFHP